TGAGPAGGVRYFQGIEAGTSGDVADCPRDLVDDRCDQPLVVAFRHDADDRLSAGLADHQSAAIAEPRAAFGYHLLDELVRERLALLVADALEQLRHLLEPLADLRHRATP